MNLTHRLSSVLLMLYKSINQTGILNFEWAQAAFVYSYFAYKKYLEDSTAKLVKNYPPLFQNGHILDIGANIGYTAFVFSKILTAPYKIFAFEPERRNVHILNKVAARYHFLDKLVITAAAVGDKEGEVEIWQNKGHHADHRILTDELRKQLKGSFEIQKTPLITIDQFLKTHCPSDPIAFIKIDVQGFELAVCRGMEKTLALNPQCIIGFEYSPSIMETLGYHFQDLIRFFQEKNYHFYRLRKNGILDPMDPETDKDIQQGKNFQGYFDIFCSQRELSTS